MVVICDKFCAEHKLFCNVLHTQKWNWWQEHLSKDRFRLHISITSITCIESVNDWGGILSELLQTGLSLANVFILRCKMYIKVSCQPLDGVVRDKGAIFHNECRSVRCWHGGRCKCYLVDYVGGRGWPWRWWRYVVSVNHVDGGRARGRQRSDPDDVQTAMHWPAAPHPGRPRGTTDGHGRRARRTFLNVWPQRRSHFQVSSKNVAVWRQEFYITVRYNYNYI